MSDITIYIVVILTIITSIILLGLYIYHIVKSNGIPFDIVKDSLPIIGSGTGSTSMLIPLDIEESPYDLQGNPLIITPLVQLDKDAHLYAMYNFCNDKGYNYDIIYNKCEYKTKSQCENDPSDKNYIQEWNDPFCIRSFDTWNKLCTDKNFQYSPGTISCDYKTKICDFPNTGPEGSVLGPTGTNLPNCILSRDYCLSKGVDYREGDDNRGYCHISTEQKVLQAIFGSTLTKSYNEQIHKTTDACNRDSTSSDCIGNASLLAISPLVTLYDMTVNVLTHLPGANYDFFKSYNDEFLQGAFHWPNPDNTAALSYMLDSNKQLTNTQYLDGCQQARDIEKYQPCKNLVAMGMALCVETGMSEPECGSRIGKCITQGSNAINDPSCYMVTSKSYSQFMTDINTQNRARADENFNITLDYCNSLNKSDGTKKYTDSQCRTQINTCLGMGGNAGNYADCTEIGF